MKRKIGIMGAHGVGKTAFALKMASDIKNQNPALNVKLIQEVARECPFPILINKQKTTEAQSWILHNQILAEAKASNYDVVVCDRTMLDNIAYSFNAGFTGLIWNYYDIAVENMKTYTELYFLRPKGKEIYNDSFRDTDKVFQFEIDKMIEEYIKMLKLEVTII